MSRRLLTPADVAMAIVVAAASLAIQAAAVEALLQAGAARDPDAALELAGLSGGEDALRVAHAMSDVTWEPHLVRVLAAILKPLLPTAPAARDLARPRASSPARRPQCRLGGRPSPRPFRLHDEENRGSNIACWCGLCPRHAAVKPLGATCSACRPCHVDVIGEPVNA